MNEETQRQRLEKALNSIEIGSLIDLLFSHNEVVSLWKEQKPLGIYRLFWRGSAWAIPEEIKSLKFKQFKGFVSDSIYESDTLNILIDE